MIIRRGMPHSFPDGDVSGVFRSPCASIQTIASRSWRVASPSTAPMCEQQHPPRIERSLRQPRSEHETPGRRACPRRRRRPRGTAGRGRWQRRPCPCPRLPSPCDPMPAAPARALRRTPGRTHGTRTRARSRPRCASCSRDTSRAGATCPDPTYRRFSHTSACQATHMPTLSYRCVAPVSLPASTASATPDDAPTMELGERRQQQRAAEAAAAPGLERAQRADPPAAEPHGVDLGGDDLAALAHEVDERRIPPLRTEGVLPPVLEIAALPVPSGRRTPPRATAWTISSSPGGTSTPRSRPGHSGSGGGPSRSIAIR